MADLCQCVADAQRRFADILSLHLQENPARADQYIRYLSFQYHLTKGVQRYFLEIAAHPDLARRRKLRMFLVNFANEEVLHYLVAANDLDQLGLLPLPAPFDVELWHAYFAAIVRERPFVRLGAACILENISGGLAKPWVKQALEATFLTKKNTKFLTIHRHEVLPHGEQILEAIAEGDLSRAHFDDLVEGARKGTVLYLRMAEWALDPDNLVAICDRDSSTVDEAEALRIRSFDMAELEGADA